MDPAIRIVSIIPADGWAWTLEDGDGECFDPIPLACWAIVERDYHDGEKPERTVEGVDPQCDGIFGLVTEWARETRSLGSDRFLRYVPPAEGGHDGSSV